MISSLKDAIKAPIATVFRRLQIKRRSIITGAFESTWADISDDVKSYGTISNQIDAIQRNKFTFGNAKVILQNEDGKYNPHDNPRSLWYGYLNQQRTLVRIQVGFQNAVKNSSGVWIRSEFPAQALWDDAFWDADDSIWDAETASTVFTGILSGDIPLSDKNEVVFNLRPLSSVFQDFPAKNLTGYTATGMTASQFVTMVRDQTDGAGSFVFRPFFGDTTTYWDISSTSNIFSNLNSGSANGVIDSTVWEVFQKLAEAENFVPYVSRTGVFKFVSRTSVDTATAFQFHGAGSFNTEYGHTIKAVNSYGFKISKYYSRVQIKYVDLDTATSFTFVESALTVSPTNNPWVLGSRTLEIENFFIPDTTTANTLAQTIFDDVSSQKKEINFSTSLVPHLDLLDRFSIFYDPASFQANNLWDQNNWASDGVGASTDMVWDNSDGDAIILQGQEFKFLSFEIDLDKFENRFIAKEV